MIRAAIMLVMLLAGAGSASAGAADIQGEWRTEQDESTVEIYQCGTRLCGKIIRLKNPTYTDSREGPVGSPIVDSHNPEPALRDRPVKGLLIMQGFVEGENATWEGGTVYDPKSGKTYRGTIRQTGPNRLELRGYVGIPLFGRTAVWTR